MATLQLKRPSSCKSTSRLCDRRFSRAIEKLRRQEDKFYHIGEHRRESVSFTVLERKMLALVELCDADVQPRSLLTADLYERFCRIQCCQLVGEDGGQFDQQLLFNDLQMLAVKMLFSSSSWLLADAQLRPRHVPGVTHQSGSTFVDESLAHYLAATFLVDMLHSPVRPDKFDKFFLQLLSRGHWLTIRFGCGRSWHRLVDFVSQLLTRYPEDSALELEEKQLRRATVVGCALKSAARGGRSGLIKFIFHSLRKAITRSTPEKRAKRMRLHFNGRRLGRLIECAAENGHIPTVRMLFEFAAAEDMDVKEAVWKLFDTFRLRLHLLVERGMDAEDVLHPDPLSSALVEGAAVERNAKLLERIFDFSQRHDVACDLVLRSFVLGSPLHSAAVGGSARVVDTIIQFAVDNDYPVSKMMEKKLGGQTPVHLAAFYGNAEAVAALLKGAAANGIDRSRLVGPDGLGQTAFDLVGTNGENVVKALIARYS